LEKIVMHPSWRDALADEFANPYFVDLMNFVRGERRKHVVFPPPARRSRPSS